MPEVLEENGGPLDLENPKKNENPLNSENSKKNENNEKKEICDLNGIDSTNKYNFAFLNYIQFYTDMSNEINEINKQNQIYLVETDFFKTNIKKLDINTQNINFDILKEKILSEKLEIPKNKLKFINSKKDISNISSNIEILNDTIVKDLTTDLKEYFNKSLKYTIKSNNEIDLIIEDITITIKKENFNIHIKDNNEKQNSTTFDSKNKEIDKTLKSLTAPTIDSNNQKNQDGPINQKKIINVLGEVNENIECNDGILSKDSDLISNNFNEQVINNLISISYKNDAPKGTFVGKPLDNSIYLDDNVKLKEKYELYHKYYEEFFEELNNIDKLVNSSIDPKNIYDDYVIINISYFNKLIKLFEPMSIYNNESIIIDSCDKLTKINNLEININQFNDRLKNLKKASIQLEVEQLINTKYKYPKKFLLIKKDLLLKFNIKEINFKLNIFKLLFGENHLFIKFKKRLIVCSKDNFFYNVNYVFIYFHSFYFENELIPNIKDKKGFTYFFEKIGFDINKKNIFRHINEELEEVDVLSEIYLIKYREDLKFKYLKLIMLSLTNLAQLTDNLINYTNSDQGIIPLFIQFIRMKKFDSKETWKTINEMLEYIKNYEIDRNLNNFQIILDIILNDMHKQLNTKIIKEDEYTCESKDKNYAINLFKKNYYTQNESIINKLFFGLALKTIIPSCNCNEKNYQCELIQYIYLEQDNKLNNLEDLLDDWGVSKINKYRCKKCNINCDAFAFKEIKEYPEILIIILNDARGEKIKEVKVPLILNISKFSYKYKLSNIISSDSKNINFNIISRDKNDELFINDINGKGKIDTKDISTYLKYPRVIFYERTDKKDDKFEETHTEVEINQFFAESEKNHSLNANTRILNSMAYLNEEPSCNNELFKYDYNNKNKNEINDDLNISHNEDIKISRDPDGGLFVVNNCDANNKINNVNDNNFGNNNMNMNNLNKMNQNNNNMNYGNNNNEKENNNPDLSISFCNNLINFNNNFKNNYNINSMNNMNNNTPGNFSENNKNNFNNNISFNNYNNFNFQMNQDNFNNNNNINMINNNQGFNKLQSYQTNTPMNNLINFNSQIQSDFNNKINKNINLVFRFDTGRECFVGLNDDNITFGNVINNLLDKYPWIKDKNMDRICFQYNGDVLNDKNKTIREYGLKDGDNILVIEKLY